MTRGGKLDATDNEMCMILVINFRLKSICHGHEKIIERMGNRRSN